MHLFWLTCVLSRLFSFLITKMQGVWKEFNKSMVHEPHQAKIVLLGLHLSVGTYFWFPLQQWLLHPSYKMVNGEWTSPVHTLSYTCSVWQSTSHPLSMSISPATFIAKSCDTFSRARVEGFFLILGGSSTLPVTVMQDLSSHSLLFKCPQPKPQKPPIPSVG